MICRNPLVYALSSMLILCAAPLSSRAEPISFAQNGEYQLALAGNVDSQDPDYQSLVKLADLLEEIPIPGEELSSQALDVFSKAFLNSMSLRNSASDGAFGVFGRVDDINEHLTRRHSQMRIGVTRQSLNTEISSLGRFQTQMISYALEITIYENLRPVGQLNLVLSPER